MPASLSAEMISIRLFYLFFKLKKNCFKFVSLRETDSTSGEGQTEAERERESQSRLRAASAEPDSGPKPTKPGDHDPSQNQELDA